MASPAKKKGNKTLPAKHGSQHLGADGKMHSVVEKTVVRASGEEETIVTTTAYCPPLTWEWTENRILAGDMLAEGKRISVIAQTIGVNTKTIYNWLQHPDFREYIDKIVLDTGMANKTLRVAALKQITQKLVTRLLDTIDELPITPQNAAALLSVTDKMLSSVAVEREQLVSIVKAQTENRNLNVNTQLDIKDYLAKLKPDERDSVEKLLNGIGDTLIDELE